MNRRHAAVLSLGLAVLPPLLLITMNNWDWAGDLDSIALTYRIAVYAGLLLALLAIGMAVIYARRGGSYTLSGLSILIALAFIAWVGPDAYLDLAAALAP